MRKSVFLIILIIGLAGSAYCQESDADSLKRLRSKPSSLVLEFVGGHIGYSLLFWPLGGFKFLSKDQVDGAGGAIYSWLGASLAVNLVGNITSGQRRSYWWGILGGLVGGLMGAPFYEMAFRYHNPGVAIRYLALSLPPIIGSIVGYSVGGEKTGGPPNHSNSYIFPWLSQGSGGIGMVMQF